MPSLHDPKLSLGWAEEHLEVLYGKVVAFDKTHKLEILTEENLKEQVYVIRTKLDFRDEESVDIAHVASDFIFRLRSSLDHLAWQLALFSTDKPGIEVCFPICERNTVDAQVKIAKSTLGIPDEAVAVMKSFQPYTAGNLYKTHHLWRLNKLWNIDKHRHLPSHGGMCEPFARINLPQAQIRKEWFDGEGEMRIPLAYKDNVVLNPDAPIHFMIEDRNEGIQIIFGDLREMYQFVADTVFPAFARFFK